MFGTRRAAKWLVCGLGLATLWGGQPAWGSHGRPVYGYFPNTTTPSCGAASTVTVIPTCDSTRNHYVTMPINSTLTKMPTITFTVTETEYGSGTTVTRTETITEATATVSVSYVECITKFTTIHDFLSTAASFYLTVTKYTTEKEFFPTTENQFVTLTRPTTAKENVTITVLTTVKEFIPATIRQYVTATEFMETTTTLSVTRTSTTTIVVYTTSYVTAITEKLITVPTMVLTAPPTTVPTTIEVTSTQPGPTMIRTSTIVGERRCTLRPAPTIYKRFPVDYTWGCSPGFICSPPDRCVSEPPLPPRFGCATEECVPAPPCPPVQPFPEDPRGMKAFYKLTPPLYPLDPYKFGLDESIFLYPSPGRSLLLWKRQSGEGVEPCYGVCSIY